jgi:hypothetical protein
MLSILGDSEWSDVPKVYSMELFSGSLANSAMVDDFFLNRRDHMIDLRHSLSMLANRMPWQESDAFLAQRSARQVKAGKNIEGCDLIGPVAVVTDGNRSNAGRPRLPTRLMVALLYLKGISKNPWWCRILVKYWHLEFNQRPGDEATQ